MNQPSEERATKAPPKLVMARKIKSKPTKQDLNWNSEDEAVCKHCVDYFECHFPTKKCSKYQLLKKLTKNKEDDK